MNRMIFFKTDDGFTLIELLVVIGIIGILAGIAIPRMTGVRDKANISVVKSDLRSIQTALELYAVENNQYPATDNLSEIEFDDTSDYEYDTDADQKTYLVYYNKALDGEYYFIGSDQTGIISQESVPALTDGSGT